MHHFEFSSFLKMTVDTIIYDNTDENKPPVLIIIWRTALLKSMGARVLEARYEVNPRVDLLKFPNKS